MKTNFNNSVAHIMRVSGLLVVISCGSGGGGFGPKGVDMSGVNPKQEGSDAEGEGEGADGLPVGEGGGELETGEASGSNPIESTTSPAETNGQAGSNRPNENPPSEGQTPDGGPSSPSKEPEIQKIFAKPGIRSFSQINQTMSFLTGVPVTNTAVSTFYNAQSTSLPTENDVKGFIGSQQVTIFKLAVEYCNVLVTDTTLRAAFFGNFNFAAAPNVAFTPDSKRQVADNLVSKFWGKDLSTLQPHDANIAMVVTLIDELLLGRNLTVATQTPGIVTGACAATLSSAPVTLY